MQAGVARGDRRQTAAAVGSHVGGEAGQVQLGHQDRLGEARSINRRQAVVAGGHQHAIAREAVQRANHGHALGRAPHRHLTDHPSGRSTAVERVQVLLQLRQVGDAVVVGVGSITARADDVLSDVRQPVPVGVEQAAMTIRQHPVRDHAIATGVQRQAGQRQRRKSDRRDEGACAAGLAVTIDLRHPVGDRVVQAQRVVRIGGDDHADLAVGIGAATQLNAGGAYHVVGVGRQRGDVGAVDGGRVLVELAGVGDQVEVTLGEGLDAVERRLLALELVDDVLTHRRNVVVDTAGRCRREGCDLEASRALDRRRVAAASVGRSTDQRAELVDQRAHQRESNLLEAFFGHRDQRIDFGQCGLDRRDAQADDLDQRGVAGAALRLDATADVVQGAQDGFQTLRDLERLGHRVGVALQRVHDRDDRPLGIADNLEGGGQFGRADARLLRAVDQRLHLRDGVADLVGHRECGLDAIGHARQFGRALRGGRGQVHHDVPDVAGVDAGRRVRRRRVVRAVGAGSRGRHTVPAGRTDARALVGGHCQAVG